MQKQRKRKKGKEAETEIEPEIKAEIDWDGYLHPASVFESKANRLEALGIKQNDNNSEDTTHKYYYAYTKDFPENGIDKSRILSYQDFFKSKQIG